MTDDNQRLVDAAANGDRAAAAALLQAYLPGLRAYIRLKMGDRIRQRESCSDLVQSVCREVLEHLDQFQHSGEAAFKRWLFTMAARKIGHRHEYWNAERRDPARELPLAANSSRGGDDALLLQAYRQLGTPSREVIAREAVAHMERAFDRLPEHYRQVILMARILGMSRAEMAAELERSEPAVGNLLFRALAQFGEELDRPEP